MVQWTNQLVRQVSESSQVFHVVKRSALLQTGEENMLGRARRTLRALLLCFFA